MRDSVRGVDRAVAAWQTRPHDAHPLILMDFDGTLVDFQRDPATVTLPGPRQIVLQSLAKRSDLAAGIVSGRRIADLRDRVPCASALFFAGLHGLEIEGPDLRFVHHAAPLAAPAISILAKELRRAIKSLPGVFIEDKTLSVAVHTRGASKADRLHATTRFNALAEPFLNDGTLRLQPGDQVLELLPNIDWTKGDAVRAIIRHVEGQAKSTVWPVYIGDDETDEDAFEEIGTTGLTIAVTKRPTSASFAVDNPAAVEEFLKAVASTE